MPLPLAGTMSMHPNSPGRSQGGFFFQYSDYADGLSLHNHGGPCHYHCYHQPATTTNPPNLPLPPTCQTRHYHQPAKHATTTNPPLPPTHHYHQPATTTNPPNPPLPSTWLGLSTLALKTTLRNPKMLNLFYQGKSFVDWL